MILENFKRYYELLCQTLKNPNLLTYTDIQSVLLPSLRSQLQDADAEQKNTVYLQVVLTDELCLEKDIAGWRDHMLEHQLFNTQHAGDQMVESLDKIIKDPFNYTKDLIYVYFLTLSFGFKGKLSLSALQKYKLYLSRILYPEPMDQTYLISEAFQYTETKAPIGFVPDVTLWRKILFGLALAYLIGTSTYWWSVKKEMKDMVDVLSRHVKTRKLHA